MSSPSTVTSGSNGNANFETYSRVLPLSIRTALDHSTSTSATNSTLSSFGRPNLSSNRSSPTSVSSTSSTITNVRVTLNYPTSTSLTSSSNRQIRLCLTNDSDPLFYFYLLITEQEYPALKQNQGLLVDFINFPSQLVSLLDKCCDDKFILVLKYSPPNLGSGASREAHNSTVLDIVESNPFKYLSHLSLVISPGSDAEVKRYLSELTVQLKDENETLRNKFQHLHSSLESELAKGKYELERKTEEILHLREEMYKDSTHSVEKYMRELALEKEKSAQFQTDLIRKFNQDKIELEEKYKDIVSTLEAKNATHETERNRLDQRLKITDTQLKDVESKLKIANDDIRLLNHELQSLRKNNAKLDSDYHEKQRVVNNLVSKLNCFESELKDKSNLITRQQEHISSLGDKCRNYEERNVDLLRETDSLNSQMKSVTSDLTKANEIIRKMQDDGRRLGKQLKTQTGLLEERERELVEKCRFLEETAKKLDDTTAKCETNEKELADCKKELEELKTTVATQEETLNSKETMITWLNRQLNQNHGLIGINQFRQTLAATSLNNSNLQPNSLLNESVPLTSSRLKPHGYDPLLETSGNNANSSVPSWMNLYNNNTGRSQTNGLFGNSNANANASNAGIQQNTDFGTSAPNANKSGPDDSNQQNQADKSSMKPITKKQARPPTWAKPNKKVTLEVGSNPTWRH